MMTGFLALTEPITDLNHPFEAIRERGIEQVDLTGNPFNQNRITNY